VDIEREMVSLADEQLRYEAATSLLTKVYQQVRSSIRER
jgi:flagellar basal body rod protein FlgB